MPGRSPIGERSNTPMFERALRYAARIYSGGEVTMAWARERFGISTMTASRDIRALLKALPVRDLHSGKKGQVRRVVLSRREVQLLTDRERG